jgi:hypothetical protein
VFNIMKTVQEAVQHFKLLVQSLYNLLMKKVGILLVLLTYVHRDARFRKLKF